MFFFNLSFTKEKIFKILLVTFLLLAFIFIFFLLSKNGSMKFKVKDTIVSDDIYNLTADNFTNVLKEVHENLNTYLGQKIHFVGYIYRAPDFKDNQCVIARNMLINNDTQSLIVGFLCMSDMIKDFPNGTWVEITGNITKGEYNGIIPIIKIEKIKKTKAPSKEFVHEPDTSFVPTSTIL